MSNEIVTATTILAGSGAAGWTATKLLGPSADALGQHIKVFLGDRIRKIFVRISEKSYGTDLKELPAGFVTSAIQKASVSEDDIKLTEMWANLLIAASDGYQTRHMVFADILSQIGPDEAKLLDSILKGLDQNGPGNLGNLDKNIRFGLGKLDITGSLSRARANELLDPIKKFVSTLPIVFERLELTLGTVEGDTMVVQDKRHSISCLVLERQNLLKFREFTHPPRIYGGALAKIGAFVPTDLGVEFLGVCSKK